MKDPGTRLLKDHSVSQISLNGEQKPTSMSQS